MLVVLDDVISPVAKLVSCSHARTIVLAHAVYRTDPETSRHIPLQWTPRHVDTLEVFSQTAELLIVFRTVITAKKGTHAGCLNSGDCDLPTASGIRDTPIIRVVLRGTLARTWASNQ